MAADDISSASRFLNDGIPGARQADGKSDGLYLKPCETSLVVLAMMVSRPFQRLGYDAGAPAVKAVLRSVAVARKTAVSCRFPAIRWGIHCVLLLPCYCHPKTAKKRSHCNRLALKALHAVVVRSAMLPWSS